MLTSEVKRAAMSSMEILLRSLFPRLVFGGLSEPNPGTAAVLIDEVDAGRFQSSSDGQLISSR